LLSSLKLELGKKQIPAKNQRMLEAKPAKVGRQPKQLKRRMKKVVARRFGPQLWLTRPWHA
jgi:hypothetical protein